MITTVLHIPVPQKFNFQRTVFSHGWCALPPFSTSEDRTVLTRIVRLIDRTIVKIDIRSQNRVELTVEAHAAKSLSKAQKADLKTQIASCMRLNEDFVEFYRFIKPSPQYRWILKAGAGRLLRAPTLFEDIVKMICTTNCSWALTEIMTGNLTKIFGQEFDGTAYTFPEPETIAGSTESFLRKHIRAGYRSPYILEFAERAADKTLDVESWRREPLPTEELFKRLRSIKGIGEYAAGNLLRLLGHYDRLGLDSWVRGKYYELHHAGRKVSDSTIEKHYSSFGMWRGLVFWLEMTQHWFKDKFPF
jgi:N-glycosylase/DNA lyase